MSNIATSGTMWNLPNYVGELFLIGANQTPFLNMVGGLNPGGGKQTSALEFPVAQPYALNTPSQPAISETAAGTAPSPVGYVRSQRMNTCQIFQKAVSVSYLKQSVTNMITADATTSLQVPGVQPVQDELNFQINTTLRQIAVETHYTFLNGTYQKCTSAAVAPKTRGIIASVVTNTIAAGGARINKALMDQLLRTMATNGAQFNNMVLFCGAFVRQMLSDIYGFASQSDTVGGVTVSRIITDFANLGVVWDPFIATSTLLIADMSVPTPVFLPVPGKGVLFYESLAKTGATEQGQIYGQIGLDHGPEEYHGTITGLATV